MSTIQGTIEAFVYFEVLDLHQNRKFIKKVLTIPTSIFDDCKTEEQIARQTDIYVEELDKYQMMIDNDWSMIIDWKFFSEHDIVKSFFFETCSNKSLLVHYDAVYSMMKAAIEHLDAATQVKIIMSAMNVGLAGIKQTIDDLNPKNIKLKIEKAND
jgi:hypothetical protein